MTNITPEANAHPQEVIDRAIQSFDAALEHVEPIPLPDFETTQQELKIAKLHDFNFIRKKVDSDDRHKAIRASAHVLEDPGLQGAISWYYASVADTKGVGDYDVTALDATVSRIPQLRDGISRAGYKHHVDAIAKRGGQVKQHEMYSHRFSDEVSPRIVDVIVRRASERINK